MLYFVLIPSILLSASLVYLFHLLRNGKFLFGIIGILALIIFLWLQGKTSPEKKEEVK